MFRTFTTKWLDGLYKFCNVMFYDEIYDTNVISVRNGSSTCGFYFSCYVFFLNIIL